MTNFLSGHLSPKGTVGKGTWEWGKKHGYSDQQLKVAIQQLSRAGVGVNTNPGQFFNNGGPMRGVAGIASDQNPLGKYQGKQGGNFGYTSYDEAKADGWTPQEIYKEIQSGRSGMFMPEGAMNQYLADIAAATPAPAPLPLPGSQTGQANVGAGYNSLGIKTKVGSDLATGGTKKAFGRGKKKRDMIAAQLAINPLT